jgi:iron complex transport system permease protein
VTTALAGAARGRARRPPRAGGQRTRRLVVLGALLALVALVMLASLAVGAKSIPLGSVWAALWSPSGSQDDLVVSTLRLPRTLLGLQVGIALGVVGGLMQGHTRNPLAEPGIFGVSAGAGFFVVLGIFAFGLTSMYGYVWFAFAGALAATVLVFLLGSLGRGGPTPVALAVAGVAVTYLLKALTAAIVLSDSAALDAFRFWDVGALTGRDAALAVQVVPFLVVGLALAAANAPALNLLALGSEVAAGLGQNLRTARWTGLVAITLLTGAAVAACGPIAFVGLMAAHAARALVGPDYRWLLPTAGLSGAVLLLAADVIGRIVVRPGELQVGIVLAFVGAPFFVALVRRRTLVRL